ncbi:hypothetical protein GCM10023068_09190 [Leifsonia shinshuensis]
MSSRAAAWGVFGRLLVAHAISQAASAGAEVVRAPLHTATTTPITRTNRAQKAFRRVTVPLMLR